MFLTFFFGIQSDRKLGTKVPADREPDDEPCDEREQNVPQEMHYKYTKDNIIT
jgi:hypothetical protein